MRETFGTFLQELDAPFSGSELLEAEVLRIMRKEGFSYAQVYEMPLPIFPLELLCSINLV
jgi:hypothetical protein